MSITIGEKKLTCRLCGIPGPNGMMVETKSGNCYHPACVINFMAESMDKAIDKLENATIPEKGAGVGQEEVKAS
jgi:hypothetical protein